MRIRGKGLAAGLLACALAVTGLACGHRAAPSGLVDAEAISVDIETLWRPESAKDPITAYRVRLATDPDNPALHNNLGNAYVLANRMEEAVREYKIAGQLDTASAVPLNNLGTAYQKMDKLGDAADAYRKAIDIDPRYALAYYNLGTLYDQKQDYDKAIEFYLKAVSLKPELMDVEVNPQVVNNRHRMVVTLRHYLEEAGNIALPLDRLPE